MTDLERKLAETLRAQAGEVTPNLDAAWAEQQRRQQRPPRRRRAAVWIAPLAAVLVVLTTVFLVKQVSIQGELRPANPGKPLTVAMPEYTPLSKLQVMNTPEILTNFVGQTHTWTTYVFIATVAGASRFCVAAVPRGEQLVPSAPQYGTKSPSCAPLDDNAEVHAGYVGEDDGPLPAGKAVYLADQRVQALTVFNANGDMSGEVKRSVVSGYAAALVDVVPGLPPERYETNHHVSPSAAHPASR